MSAKTRSVAMILLGVAILLLKGHYSGPAQEFVRSYAGNVAVSFAVYYNVSLAPLDGRLRRLMTAGLALAAVELFEASNGFGFMSNTYDPWDYLANLVGIAIALIVDATVLSPRSA